MKPNKTETKWVKKYYTNWQSSATSQKRRDIAKKDSSPASAGHLGRGTSYSSDLQSKRVHAKNQ